jgi:HK97 family phage major capsid protein
MSKELEAIEKLQDQVEKGLNEKASKATVEQVQQALNDIKAILAKMEEEDEEEAKEEHEAEEEEEKHKKQVLEFMNKSSKQLSELQEELRSQKDKGSKGTAKNVGAAIVEKLKEAGISSGMKKGERKSVDVDIDVTKVAGTFTTGNVDAVGSNSIPFSLSDAEVGLTRVVRRRPWIMELANVSSTDKMYVQWAEQENPDGGAGATTEGSDKSQADFDWVEKSKKVEKVTAFIKVSREALDDLAGLQNEINTELMELVMLQVDADLLGGNGTTPNLAGILAQDTAYSAGSFAGSIVNPNNFDVLRTAIAQVVGENFIPNYILLHPDDVAAMDLTKSADDSHYVLPPFKSADGMVISGVRIVENTGQTAGDFTVGDFTKLNIKVRKSFGIDVGYESDDFIKNLVTILGEVRLVSYIKSNHAKAFVSGDFETAIAALAAS